jgi:hypothetical protein
MRLHKDLEKGVNPSRTFNSLLTLYYRTFFDRLPNACWSILVYSEPFHDCRLIFGSAMECYALAVSFLYLIYRVFQKELYNFKIVYKFIQRTCTVF